MDHMTQKDAIELLETREKFDLSANEFQIVAILRTFPKHSVRGRLDEWERMTGRSSRVVKKTMKTLANKGVIEKETLPGGKFFVKLV